MRLVRITRENAFFRPEKSNFVNITVPLCHKAK